MPLVKIDLRKGRSREEKKALLDAVHDALVSSFKIPDHDRAQRIIEHEPEDFDLPGGMSERFTVVEITAFPGRSVDTKRALYQDIVGRFVALGIPASDIWILIHELPRENWGMRGGVPASEINFDYKISV